VYTYSYMEGLSHYDKESRPWGSFERFTLNEPSTVKVLTVAPNASLSLQTHVHRSEFWHILKGSGVIRIGEVEREAKEGDSFYNPVGSVHRITGGPDGVTFLEIAFGDFDEADITRLEDTYGRA